MAPMPPHRTFLVYAAASDLDWITLLMEKKELGVEIGDFALPVTSESVRERAFELWHIWRETVPAEVCVMVHAPYLDLVPGSPEPGVQELCLKRHTEVLSLAAGLGARAVLFHSGFNPLVRGPDYREGWLDNTVRYFVDLMGNYRGFTFLVENMWEDDPAILIELIDRVNSPQLKICLDIGHAQVYSKLAPDQWVQRLGVRLGHVHLSDNDGTWDQEQALGTGIVPVDKVITALNALGYFGTLTFEMRGRTAVLRSMEHLLKLGLT